MLRTELMALPNACALKSFSVWEKGRHPHLRGEEVGLADWWQRQDLGPRLSEPTGYASKPRFSVWPTDLWHWPHLGARNAVAVPTWATPSASAAQRDPRVISVYIKVWEVLALSSTSHLGTASGDLVSFVCFGPFSSVLLGKLWFTLPVPDLPK